MSTAYLLGLATLPALAGIVCLLLVVSFRVGNLLSSRGWFFHVSRSNERWPSDYDLRRDIWFERQIGPFFTGHWVRKEWRHHTDESASLAVNRWVGIGKARGKSAFVGKKVFL